ncbi:DUF6291 domain-containing protein [Flavobacterium sp. FlaQc-50]|uniref:DUF6291 domain-containing protein n=1 Tax=unclassified Flavobacterium TaxID=196869 RepID=UPI003756C853
MAEDKNGILVYADWIDKFEELEDDEAGRLIKHFFRYVNDQNPIAPDRLTKLMFVDIQNQLKRDLKKWEDTIEGRSSSGRLGNIKRWHNDLYGEIMAKKISLEQAEEIAKDRKRSLPDKNASHPIANIAVTDTVNDTVDENDINTQSKTPNGVVDLKNQRVSPKIDFEKLICFFNDNRGALPALKIMSDARKKRISALEKKHGKESILLVIKKTRDSNFLQGDNPTNWSATFDWITNPANFIKILEDNYINKEKGSAEKEKDPIVAGRMTASAIQKGLTGWDLKM